MAFTLSIFSAITVQKNVRDMQAAERRNAELSSGKVVLKEAEIKEVRVYPIFNNKKIGVTINR